MPRRLLFISELDYILLQLTTLYLVFYIALEISNSIKKNLVRLPVEGSFQDLGKFGGYLNIQFCEIYHSTLISMVGKLLISLPGKFLIFPFLQVWVFYQLIVCFLKFHRMVH